MPSGVSGPQRHRAAMIWLSAPEIRVADIASTLPKIHMYFTREYVCIIARAAELANEFGDMILRIEFVAAAAALPALALPSCALAQEAASTPAPPAKAAPNTPPKAAPPGAGPKTLGEVVVTGQAPAVQPSIDRRSYSVRGALQAQTGAIADALRNVPSEE